MMHSSPSIYSKLRITPYLKLIRLDQPSGIWLLLFPGWWGIALASSGFPSLRLMSLFAFGALVMRSAGCIINDLVDKKIDGKITRTKTRPLAAQTLSNSQALKFLMLLLGIGLLILLQLPRITQVLGLASLILVTVYPWMKRITYWPQAFLGLTFNWGALMGWAAVKGNLELRAFTLYAAGFFWTLFYDTIYAYQDKNDDLKIGVKSSALWLGHHARPFLYGCIAMMFLCFLNTHYTLIYLIFVLFAIFHLTWQATIVDFTNPNDCFMKFRSNQLIGWIILMGYLFEK
ncbi:MAG: 4-hydroxybenzoate octaprenyltransferase [Alphaproteobacteria bacterium]|nr:4-hydroxybenzoate octaprenyltransferase [Alphaproteobacteria bacterium]